MINDISLILLMSKDCFSMTAFFELFVIVIAWGSFSDSQVNKIILSLSLEEQKAFCMFMSF